MSKFAWVTLATNDSYSLGALVVANSLKRVSTQHQLAVLITPGVTGSMREKLGTVFDLVQEVNVLDSQDAANLALLSRPELGVTFTKLHCWRLTQYEKCVFLDADTLILQNCDELFEREELSAAPDVGWPDCFNSGVFVFKPSLETFEKLKEFAVQKGSFDGGDQGLLNLFFADWASKDISRHLPFIYNTCSTACYSYLPAFKQFGENVKILHFIGQLKPWLVNFDSSTRTAYTPQGYGHLTPFLQEWWSIFCNEIHPKLSSDMSGLAGALAQLTLGAPRSAQQEAYEENMRRQCWEAGNIDYLGKDSFDNIWKRISQTIETKSEPTTVLSPIKRDRTPTPQPEELPADEEKKKEVQIGATFNEGEEDVSTLTTSATTTQQQATEVTTTTSTTTTENTTQQKSKKSAIDVNQEIIIVPGHQKVEFDPVTNSKIVTEKTTSGYQQTITTVTPEGNTRTQIKTFFDAVEIPCEEEEEIIEEEVETTEPGVKTTTVKTISGPASLVQQITEQACELVEKLQQQKQQQETSETTTVETTTSTTTTTSEEGSTTQNTTTNETNQLEINKELTVELSQQTQPTTTIKKTILGEEEVKIETIVSEDGKTTTSRKTVTHPGEEIEIVEYEEQHITEPGEVKIITTTKTLPIDGTDTSTVTTSETTETTETTHVTTSTDMQKQVTEDSIKQQQITEQGSQIVVDSPTTTTTVTSSPGGETVEVQTTVSADGTTTTTKTVTQSEEQTETVEYQEQHIVEPSVETKTITTTKVIPIGETQTIDETVTTTETNENQTTEITETQNIVPKSENIVVEAITEEVTNTDTNIQEIVQTVDVNTTETSVEETKVETETKTEAQEITETSKQVVESESTETVDATQVQTEVKAEDIASVKEEMKTETITETDYQNLVPVVEEIIKKETAPVKSEIKTETAKVQEDIVKVQVENTEVKEQTTVNTEIKKDTEIKQVPAQTNETVDTKKAVVNTELVLANEPTTAVVSKTLADGQEVTVETQVSEDGKTKLLKKTVKQPEEEIEIEDYEETHTVAPSVVTTVTAGKNLPVVIAKPGAEENTVKTDKTKMVTNKEASDTLIIDAESNKAIGQHQQVGVSTDTTNVKGEATTKVDGNTVSTKVAASETNTKTMDQEETTVTANKKKTSKMSATQSKSTTISSESTVSDGKNKQSLIKVNTDAIVDQQKAITSDKSETKSILDKTSTSTDKSAKVDKTVKTDKTLKSDKTTTTDKIVSKTEKVEEAEKVAKLEKTLDKTVKKLATDKTEVSQLDKMVKTGVTDKTKELTAVQKKTTADKSTTKVATDTTMSKIDAKTVVEQQETTTSKTTKITGTTTKVSTDSSTKTDSATKTTKTSSLATDKKKAAETTTKTDGKSTKADKSTTKKTTTKSTESKALTIVGTTTNKETGEVTTEEIRKFEGGTEHIYTTVHKDGTKKIESKTVFDAVAVDEKPSVLSTKTSKATDSKNITVVGTTTDKVTGEVTTEEVRKFEGGTEHIYTTVRKDGTKKIASKTFYDAVPVVGEDGEEEYEEYEEEYEEEVPATTTTTATTKPTATKTTKKATDPSKTQDSSATPKLKIKKDTGTSEGTPATPTKVKKGLKTPTATDATPPETPATPPATAEGKVEESAKKKLPSALSSKKTPAAVGKTVGSTTPISTTPEVTSPVPPPRKKEVKTIPASKGK